MSSEKKTAIPEQKTFEVLVSFVPVERALLRIGATDEAMARSAITEMAGGDVKYLTIESCTEVQKDKPIPEEFEEEGEQIGPDLKTVH